jgi:hypothetical protein
VLKIPVDGERWLCKKSRIESPKVGISSCPNERINGIRWTLVKKEPEWRDGIALINGIEIPANVRVK